MLETATFLPWLLIKTLTDNRHGLRKEVEGFYYLFQNILVFWLMCIMVTDSIGSPVFCCLSCHALQ